MSTISTIAVSQPPILPFLNNAGQPNAGGHLLTQVGGVNYPTYQDPLGQTPLPNPIPLNSRGEVSNSSGVSCQLFLASGVTYTFTLFDSQGNQIWTANNVQAISTVATGNMVDARWVAGSSYTNPSGSTPGTFIPGTTTTFTLPAAPISLANVWAFFDALYQADDQISSLADTTLVFAEPVPVGTEEVSIKLGTTYSIAEVLPASVFNALNAGAVNQASTTEFFVSSGALVQRFNDRVFSGGATVNDGASPNVVQDWLTQFQTQTGALGFGVVEYSQTAALTNQNTNALIGLTVASQTLNANQVRDFWGIGGYALNNSGSYKTNAWGLYGEAHQLTSTAGACYGAEVDVRTAIQLNAIDPYTPNTQQTVGLQVASGAGFTSAQFDNSAGINIQNNGAKFNIGINIGADAITNDTGSRGSGIAMAMAYGHALQWYGGPGITTSRIECFGVTEANSMLFQFEEGYVHFLNSNGQSAFLIEGNPTAVNYLQVEGSNAGSALPINAEGQDADIDISLIPKGTGSLMYGNYTAGSISATGYIFFKTQDGTVRRLLVG